MQPEVKLAVSYDGAECREVRLQSRRFTLGRSIDDDLCIDDPSISRRHSLIETLDGAVIVSDCGSRNGTFVNGSKIVGPTALKDGDVISVGSIATIKVLIADPGGRNSSGTVLTGGDGSPWHPGPTRPQLSQELEQARPGTKRWLEAGPQAIAGIAGAMILALMLVLGLLRGKQMAGDSRGGQSRFDQQAGSSGQASVPDSELIAGKKPGSGAVSKEQVERAAVQVVKQISNDDQQYSFPPEVIDQIGDRINQYRASNGFAESLRAIAPHCREIAGQARPMIEPGFVIYTALAETAGRSTGRSPMDSARECLPVLRDIWKLLGNRTADDGLVLIAAYKIGPVTTLDRTGRKSHPLLATMRRIAQGSDAKRTVWYLYKENGIDRETYGFVLNFLAAGILAQHPKEFGIAVEPLAF